MVLRAQMPGGRIEARGVGRPRQDGQSGRLPGRVGARGPQPRGEQKPRARSCRYPEAFTEGTHVQASSSELGHDVRTQFGYFQLLSLWRRGENGPLTYISTRLFPSTLPCPFC